MLAPKSNLRGFSEKKMPAMTPVLSRSFHEHQVMIQNLDKKEDFIEIDTAKGFIHSLGGQRLDVIQHNLSLLPEKEAVRALCALNDKKSLSDAHRLIWEISKSRDVRLNIFTKLFHGNEEMAEKCCNLPLDEVLEHYIRAQKMMLDCPILVGKKRCREGHYAKLEYAQARVLSKTLQDKTIHESDIDIFEKGIEILAMTDSSLINDESKKDIMSSVRIYPPLLDRIGLFIQAPDFHPRVVDWNNKILFLLLSSKILLHLHRERQTVYDHRLYYQPIIPPYEYNRPLYYLQEPRLTQGEIDLCQADINKFLLPSGLLFAGNIAWKYWNYNDDLKNNILPNQPTLTDYFKKKSS
jgi:hypothetical protein